MRRPRVLVGIVVAVACALVVAFAWNGPALVRRWERRNDIRVVSSLEELEQQRNVMIDGVPVKLGVDTLSPRVGGAVLVYAVCSSGAKRGRVRFRGEPASRWIFLNTELTHDERCLVRRHLNVTETGQQVVEVVDSSERVCARCRVFVPSERFHTFFPLVSIAGKAEFQLGAGGAIPVIRDEDLIVEGSDGSPTELRQFPSSDARPSMRLTNVGRVFTLQWDEPLGVAATDWPSNSILARVWLNDVRVVPGPWTDPLVPGSGRPQYLERGRALRGCVFRLELSPKTISARPGDRIGVQCFLGGGWRHPGSLYSVEGTGLREGLDLLSNRVDFTLP